MSQPDGLSQDIAHLALPQLLPGSACTEFFPLLPSSQPDPAELMISQPSAPRLESLIASPPDASLTALQPLNIAPLAAGSPPALHPGLGVVGLVQNMNLAQQAKLVQSINLAFTRAHLAAQPPAGPLPLSAPQGVMAAAPPAISSSMALPPPSSPGAPASPPPCPPLVGCGAARWEAGPGAGLGGGTSPAPHPSLQKPEHLGSRASRRGPMDEMRQLVRILVKILPESVKFLQLSGDEGGSGNRVSEQQIRAYLQRTLGQEAPQPEWGLPEGWGAYLADLFSWALDRPVTDSQARGCARRRQGRSWEVLGAQLQALGVRAHAWPLPLTLAGVRAAQAPCRPPLQPARSLLGGSRPGPPPPPGPTAFAPQLLQLPACSRPWLSTRGLLGQGWEGAAGAHELLLPADSPEQGQGLAGSSPCAAGLKRCLEGPDEGPASKSSRGGGAAGSAAAPWPCCSPGGPPLPGPGPGCPEDAAAFHCLGLMFRAMQAWPLQPLTSAPPGSAPSPHHTPALLASLTRALDAYQPLVQATFPDPGPHPGPGPPPPAPLPQALWQLLRAQVAAAAADSSAPGLSLVSSTSAATIIKGEGQEEGQGGRVSLLGSSSPAGTAGHTSRHQEGPPATAQPPQPAPAGSHATRCDTPGGGQDPQASTQQQPACSSPPQQQPPRPELATGAAPAALQLPHSTPSCQAAAHSSAPPPVPTLTCPPLPDVLQPPPLCRPPSRSPSPSPSPAAHSLRGDMKGPPLMYSRLEALLAASQSPAHSPPSPRLTLRAGRVRGGLSPGVSQPGSRPLPEGEQGGQQGQEAEVGHRAVHGASSRQKLLGKDVGMGRGSRGGAGWGDQGDPQPARSPLPCTPPPLRLTASPLSSSAPAKAAAASQGARTRAGGRKAGHSRHAPAGPTLPTAC